MPAASACSSSTPFLILVGIGLSLRFVVDQAIAAPVSPLGVVVMVLLAYTIFTTTLVLQRKQAARNLAIGLASLTIPLVPLLLFAAWSSQAIFVAALAAAAVPWPAPTRGADVPVRGVRVPQPPFRHGSRSGRYPHPNAAPVAAEDIRHPATPPTA